MQKDRGETRKQLHCNAAYINPFITRHCKGCQTLVPYVTFGQRVTWLQKMAGAMRTHGIHTVMICSWPKAISPPLPRWGYHSNKMVNNETGNKPQQQSKMINSSL